MMLDEKPEKENRQADFQAGGDAPSGAGWDQGSGAHAGIDTASEEISEETEKSVRIWTEVKSWMRDLLIAVAICVILIVYIVQPFRVEKTSMEPLLHDGDRILVSKITLLYEPIRRGDVVVLWNPRNPDESWIKRVIALPGEEVRIEDGIVHINGQPMDEPYLPDDLRSSGYDNYPPDEAEIPTRQNRRLMNDLLGFSLKNNPTSEGHEVLVQRVPEGYYFVLGDNRNHSMDSRASVFENQTGGPGLIPERYIYGKALFRYWPLDKIGFIQAGSPAFSAGDQ